MLTREDLEAFIDEAELDILQVAESEAIAKVPRPSRMMSVIADAQMSFLRSWQRSIGMRYR